MKKIEMVDLKGQYLRIKTEIDSAINEFADVTGGFVGVTTHVPAFTHGVVGSVGSVGTTGVLPSVVIAFITLLPNAL